MKYALSCWAVTLAFVIHLVLSRPATADILFGGSPDATYDGGGTAGADLRLWLRADVGVVTSLGNVTQWTDQSTYGNHATQVTTAKQPSLVAAVLNGLPVVQFSANAAGNADDERLGLAGVTGQQTTFIVYNDESTAAYTTPLGTSYAVTGSYHGFSNDSQVFDATHTDPNTRNGLNLHNGSSIGNGTSTGRPDTYVVAAYRAAGALNQTINTIGADPCGACSDRTISGGIAEILVYDRQLTLAEMDSVGNYLGGKYGIAWSSLIVPLPEGQIDLADVITGGNGKSLPFDVSKGINKLSGGLTTGHSPAASNGTGTVAVPGLPYVDFVGVPDGGSGPVTYSSTGGTIVLPNTGNQTWDHVTAEPSIGGYSVLDGVDYNNVSGHTMIDLHTDTLITFDLDAVELAEGYQVERFTGVFGAPNPSNGDSDIEFRVYLDGVLAASEVISNAERTLAFPLDIPISQNDRFLTLVAMNLGGAISFDQIIVGDPRLHLATPEPSTLAIWLIGLLSAYLCFRGRQR